MSDSSHVTDSLILPLQQMLAAQLSKPTQGEEDAILTVIKMKMTIADNLKSRLNIALFLDNWVFYTRYVGERRLLYNFSLSVGTQIRI